MIKNVTHIPTTGEWASENDYDSHRPCIDLTLEKLPNNIFFEFGMGYGSTPLLKKYSTDLHSFETDGQWANKFMDDSYELIGADEGDRYYKSGKHRVAIVNDYMKYGQIHWTPPNGIYFIDGKPGELRKDLIARFSKDAKAIIVHDTEISANYVYNMKEVLSSFAYRLNYEPQGKPHTTVVSNHIDVTQWI